MNPSVNGFNDDAEIGGLGFGCVCVCVCEVGVLERLQFSFFLFLEWTRD